MGGAGFTFQMNGPPNMVRARFPLHVPRQLLGTSFLTWAEASTLAAPFPVTDQVRWVCPCRRTSMPSCRTWPSSSRRCCSSTALCPEGPVAAGEAPAQPRAAAAADRRPAVRAGMRCAASSRRWPTRSGRRSQRRPALRCNTQCARSLCLLTLLRTCRRYSGCQDLACHQRECSQRRRRAQKPVRLPAMLSLARESTALSCAHRSLRS